MNQLFRCITIFFTFRRYNNHQIFRPMKLETIVWVLIGLIGIVTVYLLARNIETRKKKRLQYALLAFQSHTNPHFIKNVLQSINWFILNNERNLASDYLCDFSRLMEDILGFSKKDFVTLAEKVKFLDLYLKLQHLRHPDKFDYNPPGHGDATIKISEAINPEVFLIPPMLIHPHIENAIEHGLKAKKEKGFLSVDFRFDEKRLFCVVEDNGIGIRGSKKMQEESNVKRTQLGIINTQKRIEIIRKLYGINIEIKIEEIFPGKEEPGTRVTIQYPMPLSFNPRIGMPPPLYRI